MLTIYRRHSDACTGQFHLADNPQQFKDCRCPVYAYGMVNGREVRRSMKTRDWGRAKVELGQESKQEVPFAPVVKPKTISEAIATFISDCEARKLSRLSIAEYRTALLYLARFLGEEDPKNPARFTIDIRSSFPVGAIVLEHLSDFRIQLRGKKGKELTARGAEKVLKILRLFCAFCVTRKWLPENFAKLLKPAKVDLKCTQPFSKQEVQAIMSATDGPYERALIMTFIYTGFRISEVAALQRVALEQLEGSTIIWTKKTRRNQYMKVHPSLGEALALVPGNGTYFFWDGQTQPRSCTWQIRVLVGRILARAGVTGHPHMFRDTFAVTLLTNGVGIRTVQLLLGHASVTTTERHYAPWVKEFQNRLDTAVMTLDYDEPASSHTPGSTLTLVSASKRTRAS